MEFVAEEGVVYLPYWMMQNLLLQEGDLVRFKSASLPKGTYVKLRPQSQDFLDITNPKAVCVAPRRGSAPRPADWAPSLETTLRKYSCLTAGDSILISYNNKRFFIDIQEVRPPRAVSIIETDCEVDFAPPLDYVEPQRPPPPAPAPAAAPAPLTAEGAPPRRVRQARAHARPAAAAEAQAAPKFAAFVGGARRLDGKAVPPPSAAANASAAPATASAATAPKAVHGKLVFGGAKPAAAASPAAPAAPPEPSKFTAFSGAARKLK